MELNREILKEQQYRIPAKLNYLADCYRHVTWTQAIELYGLAVEDTLATFGVELLLDVPYGEAYNHVEILFVDSLEKAEKEKVNGKNV